jgi:hypothetical protein
MNKTLKTARNNFEEYKNGNTDEIKRSIETISNWFDELNGIIFYKGTEEI